MNKREYYADNGLYDPRFEHDACGVGFVCDIKGRVSNAIINQGLEVLCRLSHRGATGADPKTGDGAGILIQIPHQFLQKVTNKLFSLPEAGAYGVGLVFLPQDEREREFCKKAFQVVCKQEGAELLGWRSVPVDTSCIGSTAQETQPVIEHVFVSNQGKKLDQLNFERSLYIVRKRIENEIRNSSLKQKSFFYITNLSSRTLAYKGLLMPEQMKPFFLDLNDPEIKSALCLVHSRYSTNTFPTWDLAQPFRFLAHNGEINTLRGNMNWMKAREGLLQSDLFGKKLKKILPIIVPGGSDSATLDNVFELLLLSGRSLPHAMMMLIPPAWQHDVYMQEQIKDFYRYHACLTESWDGPAAIAFTDGISIGAVLDRNGLRPCRYLVTKNDFVVMASEVGVLDIPANEIKVSGRLEPGKTFFIDTKAGRIIEDYEVKEKLAQGNPYGQWLKHHMISLKDVAADMRAGGLKSQEDRDVLLKAFGYSREDLSMLIAPMASTAQEPVGSMGNDIPHAVLSHKPQLLYTYFKQLFAQVTNPPIDPIREELVMSLESYVGPEANLLSESDAHCQKLKVKDPILTNSELENIRSISVNGFKTKTISLLFEVKKKNSFKQTLKKIQTQVAQAIKDGYTFIILSDRGVNKTKAALPALLATGAVHHFLVRKSLRTKIGLLVESAEPREVHHFALLFGYGADLVNPYLAFEAIKRLIAEKEVTLEYATLEHNYIKAIDKGILKILSKMGISTLQSYRGAQIFEAVGLHEEVIEECFCGTVSRIAGVTFETIAKETIMRHKEAFAKGQDNQAALLLASGGLYKWRRDGEFHLWNPESVAALQDAAKNNNSKRYKEFAALINDQSKNPTTLRGVLAFKKKNSIPLEHVEPAGMIVQRFVTGAMSYGSISRGAHETLAFAMNRLKGKSNTGEGGEDPIRFAPLPNGDSARSAIKQVASGRFGVTTNYLVNADEIQIKIAQGAKPGEGGQLPGHKVSVTIAKTRYTTPGVTLISPPPHHDIYSIEDLAQLIFDLKNTNPSARISVKLVSEIGVGTVAAGVAKGHADMILISGGDGGTGASPLSSIKHAGLPWELGLSETHQTLVLNNLRSRVRLQTDGQMRTGRDVVIAAMLGAEEYGFCTAALIVMGCVMLRHCHLNNCSVGVATQEEILEKRFAGKAEHVINYLTFVAEEVREHLADLGVRSLEELVGRTDLLEVNRTILPWKAQKLDLSRILFKPPVDSVKETRCTISQKHNIDSVLDHTLIKLAEPALINRKAVRIEQPIANTNRTTGAMLSGQVCKRYGENGLDQDTIYCKFKGVAGQSFGAWLANGVTFELEGMANDYVGKGLSGGKISIYPDKQAKYSAEKNSIIGNTTFYGAISGEAFIRGKAGERFCIRNSGVYAVVEGVGDHGCEYMTGGRVVILGETGCNFGAGMSGGIAYVYNADGAFATRCNKDMVELTEIDHEDESLIQSLVAKHISYTQSTIAQTVLNDFQKLKKHFVKVVPLEYKKILQQKAISKKAGLAEVSDG